MDKKKEPEKKKPYVLGAHSLSSMFRITSQDKLTAAMKTAAECGAQIYEIPFLLCELSIDSVATAAHYAGITEIALCHFFPWDAKKGPVAGDPLGDFTQRAEALYNIKRICHAAEGLRMRGIKVRTIDGPTWGGAWRISIAFLERNNLPVRPLFSSTPAICAMISTLSSRWNLSVRSRTKLPEAPRP